MNPAVPKSPRALAHESSIPSRHHHFPRSSRNRRLFCAAAGAPSVTEHYRGVPVLTVPEFGPKLLRDLASELPPLELLPNRAVALSCCLRSAPVDASRYISRPRTGRGNFGVRETSGIRRCPHAGRGDDCRRVSAGGRIGRVARLGRRCILALTSHMTSEWYALSFRIRRVSFSAQELRTVREAGNPTLRIVGPEARVSSGKVGGMGVAF